MLSGVSWLAGILVGACLGLGDACTIAAGLAVFFGAVGLAGWVTALTGSVGGLITGSVFSCSEPTTGSASGVDAGESSSVSRPRSERISSMPSSVAGLSAADGVLV